MAWTGVAAFSTAVVCSLSLFSFRSSSVHDRDLVALLQGQLDRCGPENLVCPACPPCHACVPLWAGALVGSALTILAVFLLRGFARLCIQPSHLESEPLNTQPRPGASRPPAGSFKSKALTFDQQWTDSLTQSVGNLASDSLFSVATPSSVRQRGWPGR